eukprot:jgi/Hompol1/6071/HPOL_002752-RA
MSLPLSWMQRYREWFFDCILFRKTQEILFNAGYLGFKFEPRSAYLDDLRKFENKHQLRLPRGYRQLMSLNNVASVIMAVYPTNNSLIAPKDLDIVRVPPALSNKITEQVGYCDTFIKIIDENQGCCYWFIGFDKAHPRHDPPVFVGDMYYEQQGSSRCPVATGLELAAPTLSMFIYNWFEQGLDWHLTNRGYISLVELFGSEEHLRSIFKKIEGQEEEEE